MGAGQVDSGGGVAGEWLGAAFDWWREAGVDVDYLDEAQDWLAAARDRDAGPAPAPDPPLPAAAPAHRPEPPSLGGDSARWPGRLEEFGPWWLTEPSLCDRPAAQRVLPAGPAGAALMIVVPMPEAGDDAALLAGPQGRLLDAMLAAMGFTREEIYLASALPARIAAPDWRALGAAGIGRVLAHHIALARPRKLLVLGRSDVSPLLGNDPAKSAPFEPIVNHEGTSLAAFADYGLEAMLARPALKAGFWSRWLAWTG